jgi:hypothetical protein
VHNLGVRGQTIRPEEDRRAEWAFKGPNQSRYSLPPLLMAKVSNISAALLNWVV